MDDADYDLLTRYRWYGHKPSKTNPAVYVRTWWRDENGRRRSAYMHQMITGFTRTDHEDHDPFNNCRSNLRDVTARQNRWNSRARVNGKHLKGASPDGNRWCAYIVPDGRKLHLGMFATEEAAGRAHDAAAIACYGKYASLNFPGEYSLNFYELLTRANGGPPW